MTALAPTLQAFFTQRLAVQRDASPHTVAAYRDTLPPPCVILNTQSIQRVLAVVPLGFQMGEERCDQRGVDIADVEAGGRCAGVVAGENQ